MKKIYLTSLILLYCISNSYAQWVTSNNNMIFSAGNVGIGIANPLQKLSVAGNIMVTNPTNSVNAGISTSNGTFLSLESFNNNNTVKYPVLLSPYGGKVGVGTVNPVSLFQVGEGTSKVAMGDASGLTLAYGTSYIGFNAARSGTNWTVIQDGANNGGAVIYSSIFGDIYFASIETTGANHKTLTDADLKSRIKLRVAPDGTTYAKAVNVQTTNWPDYVFKKDYSLLPLNQLESYINQNQHLPGLPSAKDVTEKGVDVGEMNKMLLKKIEELTLYVIELQKENLKVNQKLQKHHLD
jgi:hypothetical protein